MLNRNKKILLRADGNSTIGLGHVYRLLALADILKDDFEIVFAISSPDEYLKSVIKNYVHSIIELPSVQYKLPALKKTKDEIPFDLISYLNGNEIVVTDGYWFGEQYQKAVKATGAKLVCIDDLAENHFFADAVINHAPGIKAEQYKGEPYTKYYLGLDYALLRKDFFKPLATNRKPNSLFISMGGSDYYGITEKVLTAAITSKSFTQIHVLVSSLFNDETLNRITDKTKPHSTSISVYKNLAAATLIELMDSCEYALVSASTILLECYSRGMICFTGYYTNNQKNFYDGFVCEKKAIGLGDLSLFEKNLSVDFFKLNSVISLSTPLQSDSNIKEIFCTLSSLKDKEENINLRPATLQDMQLLFEWVNDPAVREKSINTKAIEWDEHKSWVLDRLKNENCKIFILEKKQIPVGQIRYDYINGAWVIDYSIAKNYRGTGLGKLIIKLSLTYFKGHKIKAIVKSDNIASNNIFINLGFTISSEKETEAVKYNSYTIKA